MKTTSAALSYRAVLQTELDEKKAIRDAQEARQPELKQTSIQCDQAAKVHVVGDANWNLLHVSKSTPKASPQQIEHRQLEEAATAARSALSHCEAMLDRVRPRITELERMLGVEVTVEEHTTQLRDAIARVAENEGEIETIDAMVVRIGSDVAERAERRRRVDEANNAALKAHMDAARAAGKEGKPLPVAPVAQRVARHDEDDSDLERQRALALSERAALINEQRLLIEAHSEARRLLLLVRLQAAELRAKAALFSIRTELIEFEAAHQMVGYGYAQLEIGVDDIAVRARVNALDQEIPKWVPAAKRQPATQEPADTDVATHTATAAAA